MKVFRAGSKKERDRSISEGANKNRVLEKRSTSIDLRTPSPVTVPPSAGPTANDLVEISICGTVPEKAKKDKGDVQYEVLVKFRGASKQLRSTTFAPPRCVSAV